VEIELWSGVTKAIIDPLGAWVTNLSDDRGDILFPKRSLKSDEGATKLRGGCHVCLPNFGPGGRSGQPQHGFGRELEWEMRERTDSSAVLALDGGRDGYEALSSLLSYQVADMSLSLRLEIMNNGSRDLRIAPAFHPYFALLGSSTTAVNDEEQDLDDLNEAVFETADVMRVTTSSRNITLRSQQLPVWAKWTDQLGSYVCIEPTVGGFTFLEEVPTHEERLTPGERKIYSLEIAW
jgi:D-hexose-6-phosphate mutarotase